MRRKRHHSPPEKPIHSKLGDIWVNCRHARHYFAVIVAQNSARHVVDYCPSCAGQSKFYGHTELLARGIDPDTLPILKDNRELTGDLFKQGEP